MALMLIRIFFLGVVERHFPKSASARGSDFAGLAGAFDRLLGRGGCRCAGGEVITMGLYGGHTGVCWAL